MKCDAPFGGIPFLGIGDFRQVAPVVKGTGCTPALLASIKSSATWSSFHLFQLHLPIRTARDLEYTNVLDDAGENYIDNKVCLDILEPVFSIDQCLHFLFPPDVLGDPLASLKRAFLTPKNVQVDEFNSRVLAELPGEECLSTSPLSLSPEFNYNNPQTFSTARTPLRRMTYNRMKQHLIFYHCKLTTVCLDTSFALNEDVFVV